VHSPNRPRRPISPLVAMTLLLASTTVKILPAEEPQSVRKTAPTQQEQQLTNPLKNPEFQPIRQGVFEQRRATLRAEADYNNAKVAHQIAELDVQQYRLQTFVKELTMADGELKLAQSDLKRAEDRLDWFQRMFDKGYVSQVQKNTEELALQKARLEVERAGRKMKALRQDVTIKQLESNLEKAHSTELAKQQVWEQEKAKLAAIQP
jgi:hypothetical protein